MKKLLLFFVFTLLTLPVMATEENKGTNNAMLYPINIEIKEVTNRTQEAQVRGHKVIIDQPKEFGADDKGPTPPEL